jgi:polyisoprenoid-binding protein YceI
MRTAVATAAVTTWAIDPAHANVEFAVKHLMIATVKGRFSDVSGTVRLDEEDPGNSAVDVTINVASIDTRQPDRDAHLRSADFFDVEHFPVMTFKSTRVRRQAEGELRIDGDLTIRDVRNPVTLRVTEEGRGSDPWGGERSGFSATAKINRRDFGLTWNQVLETGGIAVGDEVKISIDLELVRQ